MNLSGFRFGAPHVYQRERSLAKEISANWRFPIALAVERNNRQLTLTKSPQSRETAEAKCWYTLCHSLEQACGKS